MIVEDLNRAAIDRGIAGIGIGTTEAQLPGTGLGQTTTPGDHASQRRTIGPLNRQPAAAQGNQVIEGQPGVAGLDHPAIGRQHARAERLGVVERRNATVEGCAAADKRPLQGPGTAVDRQVVEVHVVGAGRRARTARATAHTNGVLQDQRVVAPGPAINLPGGRKRQVHADQATETEPHPATIGDGRTSHGGKCVAAGRPHGDATGDCPGVDERVAGAGRFEGHTSGQGAVVDHVDLRATLHRYHRRIRREQRQVEQRVRADSAVVGDIGDATRTVDDIHRHAGEARQVQPEHIPSAPDDPGEGVVDSDVTRRRIPQRHTTAQHSHEAKQRRVDGAGVIEGQVIAREVEHLATQGRVHLRAAVDVNRQAVDRTGKGVQEQRQTRHAGTGDRGACRGTCRRTSSHRLRARQA